MFGFGSGSGLAFGVVPRAMAFGVANVTAMALAMSLAMSVGRAVGMGAEAT